jgi:hypothetical protein
MNRRDLRSNEQKVSDLTPKDGFYICIECGKEIPIEDSQKHSCPGLRAIEQEIMRIFGKYQVAYRETALPANKETESDTREKFL